MEIRELRDEDMRPAMNLVLDVHMRYDPQDVTDPGMVHFLEYIDADTMPARQRAGEMRLWGCFAPELCGVIALEGRAHLGLLFVEGERHRQGIGRALVRTLAQYCKEQGVEKIDLNASDHGYGFYERLGFAPCGPGRILGGTHVTPMEVDTQELLRITQ